MKDTLYYRGREGDSLNRRISRKLVWDNRGVSEVVGTILMLAITVVLFSSITLWVSNMPEPQSRVYVEIEGKIIPIDNNDWSQGAWINLTHVGGVDLDTFWTMLILEIDGARTTLRIGNSVNYLGEFWEPTEVWTYNIGIGVLTENSDVRITIIDEDVDTQVWEGQLMGESTWFEPIIMNVWIDSDMVSEFADPGPIQYAPTDFKIFAQIIDPEGDDPDHGLNITNVWINLTSIGRGYIQLEDDDFDNVFTNTSRGPESDSPVGYYEFMVNATDYDGKYVEKKFRFSVGGEVGQNPQIAVRKNTDTDKYIWTVPENPLHGDTVQLYAKITNLGGAGALVDVRFWDNTTGTNISTEQPLINFGDYIVSTTWLASPGGLHNITVNATVNETWSVNNGIYEIILNDNQNSTDVIVLPTILLVDDDAYMNDGSSADTSSFMRASLEASDFDYDFTVVSTGGDGPSYDAGDYRLEEYDIVIWMTGYEKTNTLKANDMNNITTFLDNGGSLWLIGEGIFEDAAVTDSFLTSIYATRADGIVTVGDEPVKGIADHNVTGYFSIKNLTLSERLIGQSTGYDISTWGAGENAFIENETIPITVLATNYSDDTKRIFTQSFEFSMIETTGDMAQLTYKVITWLGKIDIKFGRDLAVSEQFITPHTVFYQQPVTITGVIRNNGFANETSVNWSLTITNALGQEWSYKSTDPGDPDGSVSLGIGQSNSYTITREWTPTTIGAHIIIFEVDPDNQIIETNENNNVLSDLLESGEIDVQYIVLVVDDEGISGMNETGSVTSALNDTLGYDYDLIYGTEANKTLLTKYNAIIWVTGDAIDPLSSEEMGNITNYLNASGRLWLTGKDCVGDLIDTDLETDYLQLNTITIDEAMPSTLYGLDTDPIIDPNPITHGMKYESNGSQDCDSITPLANGTGILYQDMVAGTFNGISHDSGTYKTVTTTFALNSINSTEEKAEMVFMILHWFDKPDERTELRITNSDIKIMNSMGIMTHPQIGDAYILQATVHNPGGDDANFLVRFMDGDTQVGADSISISANSKTTAEIVWIPLFAGQRTIRVMVDPLLEADEIFETHNNEAINEIYVYFFWDDMENGTYRWSHSSTVMLINGETPLDYFSETTLYTDIATDWNNTESNNITNCTDPGFFNSYSQSYWMQEPQGNLTAESVTRGAIGADNIPKVTETRYMDDDDVTVNGLAANDLATSQSAGNENIQTGGAGTFYVGARVYVRTIGGVETEITGGVTAVVSRVIPGSNSAGGQLYSNTWTCPLTLMAATDSVVIKIYQEIGDTSPDVLSTQFTTEQLGATQLDNVQWTFNYYLYTRKQGGSTYGQFIYGDSTYDSRIDNFQYSSGGAANNAPNMPTFVSHGGVIDPLGPDVGDDTPSLDWDFTDPDVGDIQIVYQVIVYRDSDDAAIWDSGSVASAASVATCGVVLTNAETYYWTVVVSDGMDWSPVGGGKNTFYFTINITVNQPPNTPSNPSPADGTGGVSSTATISWTCTDPDGDPITYDVYLDTSNPPTTLIENDISASSATPTLLEDTIYYWYVVAYDDSLLSATSQIWIFATGGSGSGGGGDFGLTPNGTVNINKTAVTEGVDLRNTESSTLSFWHKYNMVSGVNGGVLMVGYKESAGGNFKYRYVIPSNAYTGSLKVDDIDRKDDMGTWMRWAWNGVSTRGTFGWEKVTMDILPYVNETGIAGYEPLSDVRVKFAYYQYGSGSGYGWFIDDVRIEVSRSDYTDIDSNSADVWNRTDEDSHSGDWAWSNYDIDTGYMKAGIDNSLMTSPIDLTNARWAELSAYFKFNINTQDGAPPDGFRVEVTSDNGVTWEPLTLSVRSAWGVSGTGTDLDDNNTDGKSYTGIPDSGEGAAVADGYWVEAGTLSRLNIDLSQYSGNSVQIRFRVVTTLTVPATAYSHYAQDLATVGFGGFWVDDVIIRGETTNVYG